ncbi:hypothetical protein R1sor_026259 [Riccia sorocarpa]|uniref:Tetratricopeptide repeat protein n=1 Tax=Riccia sorocarpa TaxID=122646 RepID=A0ABD3GCC1_9MARC
MQGIALGGLVRLAFMEKDGEVIVGYLGAIHELLRVVRNVSVDSEDTARRLSEVVVFVTKCRTEMEDFQENFMWVRRHVLQSYISIVEDGSTGWLREVAASCLAKVLLYEETRKLYTLMSDVGAALLRLIKSSDNRGGRMMLDQYDDDFLEDINTLIQFEDYPKYKSFYLCWRAFIKVHMESKHLAGALEDLNEAVSFDPTNEFLWQERGVLKSVMEDYEGALVDLNESLRINSDDDLKHRAKVKFQLGDEDGAAFDAQQALCVRFRQCKPRIFYRGPRCFGVLPVTFGKFKLY